MSRVSELEELAAVNFNLADLIYIVDQSEVLPDDRSKKGTLQSLVTFLAGELPGGGTTEDLIPGVFGANAAAGTFSFDNGLTIFGENINWGGVLFLSTSADGLSGASLQFSGDAVTPYSELYLSSAELAANIGLSLYTGQATLSSTLPLLITATTTFQNALVVDDNLDVNGDIDCGNLVATGNLLTYALLQNPGVANVLSISRSVTTAIGAAGGASALPATPLGYFRWYLGTTEVRVPYYST